MTNDVHSCSPFCERPECVEQRATDRKRNALELADALDKYADIDFDNDFVPAAAELRRVYNDADSLCAALNNASMELAKVRAENEALRADAERWLEWRKGKALTVVVPTPTDDKPNRKVTVMYGPNPEPEYGKALDAAVDAAMKGTQ